MSLDELARYGLVGSLQLVDAIILGLLITVLTAMCGLAETQNGWSHPSVTGFLVILCVATAAGWKAKDPKATPMSSNP